MAVKKIGRDARTGNFSSPYELSAEKFRADVKVVSKRVLKSKQSARKFLVDTGICNADGSLTKHYR